MIQLAYSSASELLPLASSVILIELTENRVSNYLKTLAVQNFTATKLYNFFQLIPEFQQLSEHDRLILLKQNLALLITVSNAIRFDQTRELIYIDGHPNRYNVLEEEAFAESCKSLFILSYGYELNRAFMSVLHKISDVIEGNSVILQLIISMTIFLKGLSKHHEQESTLDDSRFIFYAQSKYTDLLFRYLIERYSLENTVKKFIRIIDVIHKMQDIIKDFQHQLKAKINREHVNPLMKAVFNLD